MLFYIHSTSARPRECLNSRHAFFVAVFSILDLVLVTLGGCRGVPATIPPPQGHPRTYYLDCSAPKNGNGSHASPWNVLSSVNAVTAGPGDSVLLKRGATCLGAFHPLGSGSSTAPVIVDAYGTGAQPIIDGGLNEEAVKLSDQQFWELRNLEISGGYLYGIFVSGNTPNSSLNHFHFINLNVHGAHYVGQCCFDSGEIYFKTNGVHQVLNDILIDGVSVHDSTVLVGMWIRAAGHYAEYVAACQQSPTPSQLLGSNITVENSTVHDLYGPGIVMLGLTNGTMQNNVAYNTGLCPTAGCTGGVGMWEQCNHTATVQNNESYANHTVTGSDGGNFDIDSYNNDNMVQYNYGHDSQGYCIASIGDPIAPNTNDIIRYNICSNNGRIGAAPGDLGGISLTDGAAGQSMRGYQIYNNTFYWNPAVNAPLFVTFTFSGTNIALFKNNIIYSTVSNMSQIGNSGYTFDNNIYWATCTCQPTWQWNGVTYNGFSAFQSASGQETHGYYTDPMLNNPTYHGPGRPTSAFTLKIGSPARSAGANVCASIPGCSMGVRDFFGNPLPSGIGFDIGANQAP